MHLACGFEPGAECLSELGNAPSADVYWRCDVHWSCRFDVV
jgi:hypothetical protein